jgi:hypothetical protein
LLSKPKNFACQKELEDLFNQEKFYEPLKKLIDCSSTILFIINGINEGLEKAITKKGFWKKNVRRHIVSNFPDPDGDDNNIIVVEPSFQNE